EFSSLSLCAPLAGELFGRDIDDGGCKGCLAAEEDSVCRGYQRQVQSCESVSTCREDVVCLAVFEEYGQLILVNDQLCSVGYFFYWVSPDDVVWACTSPLYDLWHLLLDS